MEVKKISRDSSDILYRRKLEKHINRLCKKNLKSKRVKVCAECPFEGEIIRICPEMSELFKCKRRMLKGGNRS